MQNKRYILILISVVALLAISAYWLLGNKPDDSYKVIFKIGIEDEDWQEFKTDGWEEISSYSCQIGVDCLNETFPSALIRSPDNIYYEEGVVELEIVFSLDKKYDDLVLRLARGGAETSIVEIDSETEYTIAKTILGSGEGVVGSYDLELGALNKGTHTLRLTVADDGEGNGACGIDAIILYNSPS